MELCLDGVSVVRKEEKAGSIRPDSPNPGYLSLALVHKRPGVGSLATRGATASNSAQTPTLQGPSEKPARMYLQTGSGGFSETPGTSLQRQCPARARRLCNPTTQQGTAH